MTEPHYFTNLAGEGPIGTLFSNDGSVFVTSGARNPTNTIMAVALRIMRHLAGAGATGGSGAART